MHGAVRFLLGFLLSVGLSLASPLQAASAPPHHYVFFNRDRERIADSTFLTHPALEGAQIKYTWRSLEPRRDEYDFADLGYDLQFLRARGKRLFIQVQDASFDPAIRPFPRYLLEDPAFHGGADQQYTEANVACGWMARRWDPAVRERFHQLLLALGRRFDGRIEGINLPETAIDLATDRSRWPRDFTPEAYREAILTNLVVLKRCFPRSVTLQYANFMPGDRPDLEKVYARAVELQVGLGGPDLLPYKPYQMANSYPLIRQYAGVVPMGIAVQDGNYAHHPPESGRPVTVPELVTFATGYLGARYVFWCTEEPYYTRDVLPYLRQAHEAQGAPRWK